MCRRPAVCSAEVSLAATVCYVGLSSLAKALLHAQVDQLLSPDLFSRPTAVLSLALAGVTQSELRFCTAQHFCSEDIHL